MPLLFFHLLLVYKIKKTETSFGSMVLPFMVKVQRSTYHAVDKSSI